MKRLIVTLVVIGVVIVVVLAAAGVLRFHDTKDESTITIDKRELKEKTEQAVETTKEAGGKILDKTGETLHEAAERLRGSPDNQHGPTKAPAAGATTRQPNENKNPPKDKGIDPERPPTD